LSVDYNYRIYIMQINYAAGLVHYFNIVVMKMVEPLPNSTLEPAAWIFQQLGTPTEGSYETIT